MRFRLLGRLTERTRRIYMLCKYYNNLLIYNTQKSIDYLWHGKRRQTASIPFMITAKMNKSLHSLGYEDNDIKIMTPSEAVSIIKNNKEKPPRNMTSNDSQDQSQTRKQTQN